MANHFLDYVGLNTFIYELSGHEEIQDGSSKTEVVHGGKAFVEDKPRGAGAVPFNSYIRLNHVGIETEGTRAASPDLVYDEHLGRYKNHNFSHNLINTASFFPALMIRRNGAYGWPGVRSLRLSENPVSRGHRKNNTITVVSKLKGT